QLGVVERSVLNRGVREIPSCNAHRCPPLFIRSGECQRQARMAFDERAELAANVSAGPENTDGYLIHSECIIIQQAGVNQHPGNTVHSMANKPQRHAVILELIAGNDVGSHEQLRKLLERRGVSVTQATLSRDLRELGLVRLPGDNGARYALPEKPGDTIPSLKTLLPQLFSSIDGVGELIVLHTLASGAQPVSEAID